MTTYLSVSMDLVDRTVMNAMRKLVGNYKVRELAACQESMTNKKGVSTQFTGFLAECCLKTLCKSIP